MEVLQDPSLWLAYLMCQMQSKIVFSDGIFRAKFFSNFLQLKFMYLYRRLNPRLLVQVGVGLGLLHLANMSNISLTPFLKLKVEAR